MNWFVRLIREGYRSDADMILGYCQFARNVAMEAYPHQLEVKVKTYLYDYGSWKDSPWVTRVDSLKAEMYFLTPSDVPEQYRGWVDNLWYEKNVVHEYVHIPIWRDGLSIPFVGIFALHRLRRGKTRAPRHALSIPFIGIFALHLHIS